MWCFQRFGFEAAIVAELQRQQQCNQFCDILLQAEGILVPAHSVIISSQLTSLSHKLPPPTGQSCVLQLSTLNASTLLRVVQLLYTGKMTGEGEKEKQDAISAAVNMGIDGLVEVPWERDVRGCQRTEVGVQTETGVPLEEEGNNLCRYEEDGCDSSIRKDSWTQTEEPRGQADLPSLSMSQSDDLLFADPLPNIPLPVMNTQDGVQNHLTPTVAYNLGFNTIGCTPYSYDSTFHALLGEDTPSCAHAQTCIPSAAAGSQWEEGQLEHFQDNIPGFISSFLNPETVEHCSVVRGRRRRGARRPGTGKGRAWMPKTGKAHVYLTQIVDVQNVGVSRQHKKFRQRWGMTMSSRGLGGGAAGRKMRLTTREQLNPAETCQRRRVFRKVWEFDCDGQIRLVSENAGRGRKAHTRQPLPKSHVQSAASRSSHVMPTDRSSLHPVQPTCTLPADALLHTTSLPPPEVDPDSLLDRVMLSLDILPNISRPNPQDTALRPSTTESNPSGEYLGLNVSSAIVPAEREELDNGHTLFLQQGQELADILENILQTYEQYCQSLTPGEDPLGDRSTGETTNDMTQHEDQLSRDSTSAVRSEKSSEAVVRASSMTVLQKLSSEETGKYFNVQQDEKLMKIPVVKIINSDSLLANKSLQSQKVTVRQSSFVAAVIPLKDNEDQNFLTTKKQRGASHHRRMPKRPHPINQANRLSLNRAEPESLAVQAQTDPQKRPLWPGRNGRRKEKKPSESLEESQQWLPSLPGRKIYPIRSKLKKAPLRERLSFLRPVEQLQNKPAEEKPWNLLCLPAGILQRKMRAKRRAETKLSDGIAVKKICWESFTCEQAKQTGSLTWAASEAVAPARDCKDRIPFVELKPVALVANEDSLPEDPRGDIDVVGGSCPSPEIVVIDWDELSGSEEDCEIVDVIGL